ncbi:hypothetical protein D3C72_746870 [compost metagenome]
MAEPIPWSAAQFFEGTDKLPFVQAAYAKLPDRDPNFHFYAFERVGTDGVKCTGAVMRPKLAGPFKGDPTPATTVTVEVVVTAVEIEKFKPNQGTVCPTNSSAPCAPTV